MFIRFTLPKRNFERILLINFIMWPVHPAKGYWLWRIGFDPVVEGQNWHSAPIPALQRHSWHITHYCMMNLNPHDPSAKQNLQHPAVRNLLRQIIWNSKSEKMMMGTISFAKNGYIQFQIQMFPSKSASKSKHVESKSFFDSKSEIQVPNSKIWWSNKKIWFQHL